MRIHPELSMILTRYLYLFLFVSWCALIPLPADSADDHHGEISLSGKMLINSIIGSSDRGLLEKNARLISIKDLIAALYGTDSASRNIALDMSGYLPNPLPFMDYQIAFMKARERRAAQRAAAALLTALKRLISSGAEFAETVPGHLRQMAEELKLISSSKAIETDIRICALKALDMLGTIGRRSYEPPVELLEDRDPAMRLAAMNMLNFPLSEHYLSAVAKLVTSDEMPRLRGSAAGILCENALAHHVKRPSDDLKKIIIDIIEDESCSEYIAGLLVCLSRLPYAARGEITDKIVKHSDKKVVDFWTNISKD
jgi:hypothetical protein